MKRLSFLFIFIAVIGGVVYTGCANTNQEPSKYDTVNQLDGVSMRAKKETISSTGLTLLFENSLDKEFTYGEEYVLETKTANGWDQVPIELEEDYGFQDIGFILPAHAESEWTVDWEWLYGPLDPGNYRIVKDMLDVPEAGDYESFPLAAEFSIE